MNARLARRLALLFAPACLSACSSGDPVPGGSAGQTTGQHGSGSSGETSSMGSQSAGTDSDSTDATTAAESGGTTAATTAATTNPGESGNLGDCTEITVSDLSVSLTFAGPDYRTTHVTPALGDPRIPDALAFHIFEFEHFLTTPDVDLSQPPYDNVSTCPHCLILAEDQASPGATPARIFFQREGHIDLQDFARPIYGRMQVTSTGVILEEVTVDDQDVSTPVEGGACLRIADGTWGAEIIEGWTCYNSYYNDGSTCHCGCGIPDPDCDGDAIADACDVCDSTLSCSAAAEDGCPGLIDPTDNAHCDVSGRWSCNPGLYNAGDGVCNCGCGVWDPDCDSPDATACDVCNDKGACGDGSCIGNISGAANYECTSHAGWTCADSYYGDGEHCDCGCGIADPDCSDLTTAACEFCNGPGSCDESGMGCPGTLVADDNTQCRHPIRRSPRQPRLGLQHTEPLPRIRSRMLHRGQGLTDKRAVVGPGLGRVSPWASTSGLIDRAYSNPRSRDICLTHRDCARLTRFFSARSRFSFGST